jgi:putative hydrolase of the HAD superfamily
MGGTLLTYHPPDRGYEDMEKSCGRAFVDLLTGLGYSPPPIDEALDEIWEAMLAAWISIGEAHPLTLTLNHQLSIVLQSWGIKLSDEEFHIAEHAYMTGAQRYTRPFSDAVSTLEILKSRGYPIGLISNTLWEGIGHQYDLMYYGLWRYFDFALFSSDELAWKPFPPIFERAVQRMKLRPEEVVYVGDNLYFDIYGAQQAGLKAAWIEQPQKWVPPKLDVDAIIPDFTVKTLTEFLSVLEEGEN